MLPANNMSYCKIDLNDIHKKKYIDITRFKSNDMINYTDIINLGYKSLDIDIFPPFFWQRAWINSYMEFITFTFFY